MSLLAKRTGLIVVSALLIFSCKEKENIGFDSGVDKTVGAFFTDTLTLTTAAQLENDSIASHDLNLSYVGAFKDNLFGDVSAETFIELVLADENKAGVVDSVSAQLFLDYDYYYGDTTQSQTINIREIKNSEELKRSTIYYTSKAPLQTESTLLDSNLSFILKPVTTKGLQKIALTKSFGETLLTTIGTGKSVSTFSAAFKGIALTPKDDLGVVIGFNLSNNRSYIKVGFKNSSGKPDSIRFFLNTSGARYHRFIRNSSTSSALSALQNSGDQVNTSGSVYVQSGVGIRSKVQFPTLSNLKNTLGNVVINRAELVIKPDQASLNGYPPVLYLHLLKLTSSGNVRKYYDGSSIRDDEVQRDLSDVRGHNAPLYEEYNTSSKSYTLNISTYLNAVLQGVEENNGLIIEADYLVKRTQLSRTFANAANVKLNIYYTKIN